MDVSKNKLYSGIVWVLSGLAMTLYGLLIVFDQGAPGVEELLEFLNSIQGKHIYLAAFLSVFFEGLYFIGNFFPGSSLVIILAILSYSGGWGTFLLTILTIFLGWCLAGVINIYIAKTYRKNILKLNHEKEYDVKDRVWATWFPVFRSSYEVAQIAEGGKPLRVFISSLRVRFWATLFVGAISLLVPLFLDIQKLSDKEGLLALVIVAVISFTVGGINIRKYFACKKL